MEAIKKAVEVGLGAAFVSRAAVHNEVQLGRLAVLHVEVPPPPAPGHGTRTPSVAARPYASSLAGPLLHGAEMDPVTACPVVLRLCGATQGVPLSRQLMCVTDPVRYCSHAVRAFIRQMFGLTVQTTAQNWLPPPQVRPQPLPDLATVPCVVHMSLSRRAKSSARQVHVCKVSGLNPV